jgi:hypothetical protein
MNAPFVPPATAARYSANIAAAKALHEASGNLLAALTRSGGKYSTRAIRELIAVDEAFAHLEDDFDGNALAAAAAHREELPEDEPASAWFDASGSHPDRPGGW